MERPRPGMDESLLGGEPPPLFSTQQRMLLVGHCTCNDKVLSKKKSIFWFFTSSRTVSHMRLARAWMHLPGQAATFAVCVTEPRSPAMQYLLRCYLEKVIWYGD